MTIPKYIRTKRGIKIFLLIFISLQLITGVVIYYETGLKLKEKEQWLIDTNEKRLFLNHQFISDYFDPLISDVKYLSKFQSLSDFVLNATDSLAKERLEHDLKDFTISNANFAQVRLLDKNGMELIRLNQNHGEVIAQHKSDLQNKSERPYFKESIKLSEGEVYVSPMDLNMEHGEIEKPYKPMIRVATPVYQDDVIQGVIVINYTTLGFLDQLKQVDKDEVTQFSIFNASGYYLLSPDQYHVPFGFMFNDSSETSNFKREFPEEWDLLANSADTTIITDHGLFSYTWIDPYQLNAGVVTDNENSEIRWGVLCYIDQVSYQAVVAPYKQRAWLYFIVLFLVNMIGAYRATRYRIRELMARQEIEDLNLNLEHKVRIRTRQLSNVKDILETQITELNDSLNYAKRVQETTLPEPKFLDEHIPDSFVIYLPKNVVSGDFYWARKIKVGNAEKILCAVGDATGHGVPGAMVSIICTKVLNEVVLKRKVHEPAKILDMATEMIEESFTRVEGNLQDGMDISLCLLDTAEMKLSWAGAHSPLWIVRKSGEETEFFELKGNKQPVGIYHRKQAFDQHEFDLRDDDMLYMFSDGFADQFGGPRDKKITRKRLKQIIMKVSQFASMSRQKDYLQFYYDQWKSDNEQIDDVCFMGLRV